VHDGAIEHPELALILFDIKPSATTVEHVEEIVNDIHTYLNYGPGNLNVLLSVASIGDASAFDKAKILAHLGPREGVNIDQENDVDDVLNFFFQQGYAANINYGDGTAIQGLFLPRAPSLRALSPERS
jgi:hypothetical protein